MCIHYRIAKGLSLPHVRSMKQNAKEQHARNRYVETFGDIAARSGLPAIAGKIAALLYLSPDALSFTELRQALGVSTGSVSTNTRLLEEIGTIIRIVPKGGREHFFQSAPDANVRTIERDIARYEAALAEITAANADIRDHARELPASVSAKMDGIERLFHGMSHHARNHLSALRKPRISRDIS